MPSSRAQRLFVGVLALALGGCAAHSDELVVRAAGLSPDRPETTIGAPDGQEDAPWRMFEVQLPTRFVRKIVAADSTFHLSVTDCGRDEDHGRVGRGVFSIEDVYVNGATLNLAGSERVSRSQLTGSVVEGVAYVSAKDIEGETELCFQASGGSMLGFRFDTNVVRVRPEPF